MLSVNKKHHTSSPFHNAYQILPNTKKTVLDAVDGYHAITLDKTSHSPHLSLSEADMFLKLAQGFIASGDDVKRQ